MKTQTFEVDPHASLSLNAYISQLQPPFGVILVPDFLASHHLYNGTKFSRCAKLLVCFFILCSFWAKRRPFTVNQPRILTLHFVLFNLRYTLIMFDESWGVEFGTVEWTLDTLYKARSKEVSEGHELEIANQIHLKTHFSV